MASILRTLRFCFTKRQKTSKKPSVSSIVEDMVSDDFGLITLERARRIFEDFDYTMVEQAIWEVGSEEESLLDQVEEARIIGSMSEEEDEMSKKFQRLAELKIILFDLLLEKKKQQKSKAS